MNDDVSSSRNTNSNLVLRQDFLNVEMPQGVLSCYLEEDFRDCDGSNGPVFLGNGNEAASREKRSHDIRDVLLDDV